MKKTAHTPGPWSMRKSSAPYDGQYDFAVSAEGSSVLAEAFGRTSDDGIAPAEANARLIAAAPDLLTAAMMVVEAEDSYEGNSIDDENCRLALGLLRAAIAKAEGRSAHQEQGR